MTTLLLQVGNGVALLLMPLLLTGLIGRTKALWSGRRGPPILQPAYDLMKLLRKRSVYSTTTTPLFRIAPWVFLLSAMASALCAPLLGAAPLTSFPFDFVCFAYLWALGRVALLLAALDTGSAFAGMAAAREATFSTLLEPALFLVTGALSLATGSRTLAGALALQPVAGDASMVVWLGALLALFLVLQVESARLPIDDPTTHLELTMIHEGLVLDHSGPDLAAIQYGSALKLFVGAAIVATLLNPWRGEPSARAAAANLGLGILIAAGIGTIESLIARLQLLAVPRYIAVALIAAVVALLATAWQAGAP